MVPVIRDAGDLNITGIAKSIGDLAARTRSGDVKPEELSGSTFTVTNTGSAGALFDTPIINQPEVAILGVGTIVKRPAVVRDADGNHVAIEVKRRGGIDGVEQLTRYLSLLGRDALLGDVTGIFAAQEITKQARTLAEDRGIRCVVLDYDAMRGVDDPESRLF